MKGFFQFLITAVVVLAALKLLVLLLEPKLTFFPYRQIYETPEDRGIQYQELDFSTGDGKTLNSGS